MLVKEFQVETSHSPGGQMSRTSFTINLSFAFIGVENWQFL